MSTMDDAYQWRGRTIIGSDGEKIGTVKEIYEDSTTGHPEWATVSTGLFGNKSNFVPLAGASSHGEDVRAQVTKAQVKDAPSVAGDDELSEQEERRLFEHYGVPYSADGSTTALGAPQQVPDAGAGRAETGDTETGRAGDGRGLDQASPETATTRPDRGNEGGGQPGSDQPGGGRRRMRRYVVTEVTTTVPVSDEETEIEGGPTDSTRR